MKWIFIGTEGCSQCSASHFEDQSPGVSVMFWAIYGSHLGSPRNWLPEDHILLGDWLIRAGVQRHSSLFQFWVTLLGNPNWSSSWDCLGPFTRLHYIFTSLVYAVSFISLQVIHFLQTNLYLKICFPGTQLKTIGARRGLERKPVVCWLLLEHWVSVKKYVLIYGSCQFPWYKYVHLGRSCQMQSWEKMCTGASCAVVWLA